MKKDISYAVALSALGVNMLVIRNLLALLFKCQYP